MVKQIVFLVLSVMALSSCSTEQNAMEPIRMSDVISSGCTSSFSAKESHPEYYESEMEKSPNMVLSVDAKGAGHFNVTDLRGNCALNGLDLRLVHKPTQSVSFWFHWATPLLKLTVCATIM